jgi:hypothetical protein
MSTMVERRGGLSLLLLLLSLWLVACSGGEAEEPQAVLPSTPFATSEGAEPVAVSATATLLPVTEPVPTPTLEAQQPAEVEANTGEELPSTSERQVPNAHLEDSGGERQQAITGSYCWDFAAEGVVATMRVVEWQVDPETEAPGGQVALSYDAPLMAQGDLEPAPTISWEAPPIPGEYLLDVHAVFPAGSISYGWHLLVTEP